MIKKMIQSMQQWLLVAAFVPGLALAAPPQSAEVSDGSEVAVDLSFHAGVDINVATAEELAQALQGVGLKRAEAIVAYRDRFGQFYSAEELSAVKGIGPNTISRNLSRIRVKTF